MFNQVWECDMSNRIKLGIVGVGKIVRDQHLPSIAKNGGYELLATASRNASVEGVASYKTIEAMLAEGSNVDAVSLCMPPQYRFDAACFAIKQGLHVLLEKPPGATVSEVEYLIELAQQHGVCLYATWHSRHAAAVESATTWLADKQINSVDVAWKEDVKKWHPDQEWIWQAGGLGVFDPGINGLSILTHILPQSAFVTSANLSFPANKAAPIAADIVFSNSQGIDIKAFFDWRQKEGEVWEINVTTSAGRLSLINGGSQLLINGELQDIPKQSEHGEYEAIYQHFYDLLQAKQSDVDLAPLKLVADAFMLGEHTIVEAF